MQAYTHVLAPTEIITASLSSAGIHCITFPSLTLTVSPATVRLILNVIKSLQQQQVDFFVPHLIIVLWSELQNLGHIHIRHLVYPFTPPSTKTRGMEDAGPKYKRTFMGAHVTILCNVPS